MVSKISSAEIICNGTATAVTSTPCSYISSVSLDRAAVIPSLLRFSLPILLLFTSDRSLFFFVAEERKMARREDDSYTNGSVFEVSVEEGRKDKSEAYAIDEPKPAQAEADDDALCGMSASVSFIQQVMIIICFCIYLAG